MNAGSNTSPPAGAARPLLTALAAAFLMYWTHRALQLQYHRHCKADLIRVVLFNQSTMCSHIASVLQLVELACNHAVRLVTGHVVGMLNVMAGGLFAAAGAAAGAGAGAAGAAGAGSGLFQIPMFN
jgi:hypothetical protein